MIQALVLKIIRPDLATMGVIGADVGIGVVIGAFSFFVFRATGLSALIIGFFIFLYVEKPNGIQTEMGSFYFARHPDYLPNF